MAARKTTSKTTTTNASDAMVTREVMEEMTEAFKIERATAQSMRQHLITALSSLEDIAENAWTMLDEVEKDTPLEEICEMFKDLSNEAAQALTGHVWAAAHRNE